MKPITQNHFNITFKVPRVRIYPAVLENLTLGSEVPKVTLRGGDEAHFLDEVYTYSVKINGIYQKDPSS